MSASLKPKRRAIIRARTILFALVAGARICQGTKPVVQSASFHVRIDTLAMILRSRKTDPCPGSGSMAIDIAWMGALR